MSRVYYDALATLIETHEIGRREGEHAERATALEGDKFGFGVASMSHKILTELTAAGEEIMLTQVVAQLQARGVPIPAHVLAQLRVHRQKREQEG